MPLSAARRWSLGSGLVYGIAATVPVVFIAFDTLFIPAELHCSLLVGAALSAAVVGAGAWYVAVERRAGSLVRAGASSGLVTGIVTHLPLWLVVVLSQVVASPGTLTASPTHVGYGLYAVLLGTLLYAFFSLVIADLVTGPLGALVGAVLGFARWRSLADSRTDR